MDTPHRLFTYGTLQNSAVQRAVFGRTLDGAPDAVTGYRLGSVTIADPQVLQASGLAVHRILHPTGDPRDVVDGQVLALTDADLIAADAYETDAYRQVTAKARSGLRVFVYVAA